MSILDENRKLKDQVSDLTRERDELKKLADVSADMEYVEDGGFYIRISERAVGKNIPYCPNCWKGGKGALNPLNPTHGEGYYECAEHKIGHQTSRYRQAMENINHGALTGDDDFGGEGWMAR